MDIRDIVAIETKVILTGTKNAIVSALNRAIGSMGTVDSDDTIEAINQKIKSANAKLSEYMAEFTLMDFLDAKNRMESPCKDYVLSFIDDEEPDGNEDYSIDIKGVEKDNGFYSLILEAHIRGNQRSYTSMDWQDWCQRMISLYNVQIDLQQRFSKRKG